MYYILQMLQKKKTPCMKKYSKNKTYKTLQIYFFGIKSKL
jgi:hypothetical protein